MGTRVKNPRNKRSEASTIKSRKETISARKPKTLKSILKGQTKLSKSFKESLAIGAAVAGPGKLSKAFKGGGKIVERMIRKGSPKGKPLKKSATTPKEIKAEGVARKRTGSQPRAEKVTPRKPRTRAQIKKDNAVGNALPTSKPSVASVSKKKLAPSKESTSDIVARNRSTATKKFPPKMPSERGGKGPNLRSQLAKDKSPKADRARKRMAAKKQFKKESKAIDKAIDRANKADKNPTRAANRAKLKRLTDKQVKSILSGESRLQSKLDVLKKAK